MRMKRQEDSLAFARGEEVNHVHQGHHIWQDANCNTHTYESEYRERRGLMVEHRKSSDVLETS